MSNTVIILRGPSGAGKSTWIKEYVEMLPHAHQVVSADHFFAETDHETGEVIYNFNPAKLAEAHNDCMKRFVDNVSHEFETIIVDNTSIRKWEHENYEAIARQNGYDIMFVEFRPKTIADIKKCAARNTHRVPREVIARMCIDFEPLEMSLTGDYELKVEMI